MSSSGKVAFVLCSGIIGGGLVGFQVQRYMLESQRRKESEFIEREVEKRVRDLRAKETQSSNPDSSSS